LGIAAIFHDSPLFYDTFSQNQSQFFASPGGKYAAMKNRDPKNVFCLLRQGTQQEPRRGSIATGAIFFCNLFAKTRYSFYNENRAKTWEWRCRTMNW
jgi:hypothetical protein